MLTAIIMAITMFITKFHPKVCSHIPDRSLIPDILLWNTNSSEMNIPAKLAKNIAKTASRNIFIILFMHSETIFLIIFAFFGRMQCANNDTLHSDILLFNDYFFYFRERTVYCFAVYFSVSAYFVITGLACGKFLFCHASSFCGFYTDIFTIF